MKRICLENLLPQELATCIKDLLAKKKSTAGTQIYYECKVRLLKVHGIKPENNFTTAQSMVLTGLPSTAGKEIRDMVCLQSTKLTNCCCSVAVGVFWRALLPPLVKAAVANYDLKTQFDDAMDHADLVFNGMKANGAATAVAAARTQQLPRATRTRVPAQFQ